jgi:hypothetical protein
MTFPADYGLSDLDGKRVAFQVHVHRTMEPLTIESYEDLDEQALRNNYQLEDTEALRQHNIDLYYKVLRGAAVGALKTDMTDALILINLYLKLGFLDQATAVAGKLLDDPTVLIHAAHIFRTNGQPVKALELLDRVKQDGPGARLIQAQALYDLDRPEESEAAIRDMKLTSNVQLADLRVKLAARLALPLDTFLEREEILLDAKTQGML